MKAGLLGAAALLGLAACQCNCKKVPDCGATGAAPVSARNPSAADPMRDPEAAGAVLIRLHNVSDTLELRAAYALFPADSVLFGDLPASGYSDYHRVKRSYRYAYLRVQGAGREWSIQPTDFVGEKLLKPGRYTWEIKPHDGPYPGFLDFQSLQDKSRP